jgi:GT2 family glycosyltransferase
MLVELIDAVQMTDLDIQILIADNGLGEPTLGALRELGAAIVPMGSNRGFAAAVNRAVARAEGEVLAVLNDDLVPRAGFLSALVEPVANGAAMAAGVLLQYDRPHLIESAGVEVDTTFGAHDYLRDEPVEILERPLPPPLSPCGAAAAYRLDAFRWVGGFDEGFFAYFEDLDLTLRLRAEGGSCALAPAARAVHLGSATLGYRSVEKAVHAGFSRGYLLRKYGLIDASAKGGLALAEEAAASVVLAWRHRSLAPARARVLGWRACSARRPRPSNDSVAVSLRTGIWRRYSRASYARP